jgi:ABC-type multidrug transport system ATPase subunit
VCDHAVIMHHGRIRFVGSIDQLRGARGRDSELAVEVKVDAQKLADTLSAAGATCKVTSPIALEVDLPVDATSQLVFAKARDAGLQIRALEVRRESIETAFLRVIGEEPAAS